MSIFDWLRGGDDDCPPVPRPADPPKHPRFCRRCGSALAYECDAAGFNERTGEPVFSRWAHCPKWTGGRSKQLSPIYGQHAETLNESFTASLYPSWSIYDAFYIDCAPEYKPAPERPARKAAAK